MKVILYFHENNSVMILLFYRKEDTYILLKA